MPRESVHLIRGARVPAGDGLSGPCDVTIADNRIAGITPAGCGRSGGGTVLDAGGRVLLPGLVDVHCHGAAAVFTPEVQLALLRQGVTTIVVGQDGIGYAPSDAASYAWSATYFAGIDGVSERVGPGSVAAWLGSYDGAVPVNVAVCVPHGSLRYMVAGPAQRALRAGEVRRAGLLLEEGLRDGAVGLSTGLEYVPAAWADRTEMVALLEVVARLGRVHSSHMRGYEAAAPGGVAELADWARASGAATHIAHLHGDASVLGAALDEARAAGVGLTFDSYDYLRGYSLLSMVSLPTWLPLADPGATVALLAADPDVRRRLSEHLSGLDDLWERTTMAWADGADPVTGERWDWVAGLGVRDVAARLGVAPAEAVLRLLTGTALRACCVFAQPPTNSAASVAALADRAEHMGGSDAIYVPFAGDPAAGRPHPRGWGATTRWLAGKVVRDGAWTWAQAVDHLSARAVRRFGLGERGRLAAGAVADLVLVDPLALRDQATYDRPRTPAMGVDDVLVAGVQVLSGGALTGATPGGGLRWQAAGVR